jgi:3-hydroxyacyl-[acyl-carrier-protein] dehydratase
VPPTTLFDISNLDLDKIEVPIEEVRKENEQRYEFEMIDGIVHVDVQNESVVAVKDVRTDEFWCRGHIPGDPIFPGVLMLEAAAQTSTFIFKKALNYHGFIGFAGIEDVKFRQPVRPPAKLIILAKITEKRRRRVTSQCQGWVDGKLAFEATIIGMPLSIEEKG